VKKIRILSLDGGGIRGIIPGVILSYLEKQLQLKDNSTDKIGDYFDFIAGTSTGGILACCYLMPGPSGKARYAADEAVKLYLDDGRNIFHSALLDKITRGFGFFNEKYSVKSLEKDLKFFFEDETLDRLIKPCLITSYEITSRTAYFFTSADACEPLNNFKVHDVARATSAAPTYFEPALIKSQAGQQFSLIDGGVFANNPALCAYAEARKTNFSKILNDAEKPDMPSAKDMIIVSIGTGTVKHPYHFKHFKNAGQLKWLSPIIDILMSGNSETVDYQLSQMYKTLNVPDKNYYRLEPSLREALSDMDNARLDNLANLHQAGLWFINKNRHELDEIVDKLIANK
jgi:patatin-like phospholipase/acyl hydrolase